MGGGPPASSRPPQPRHLLPASVLRVFALFGWESCWQGQCPLCGTGDRAPAGMAPRPEGSPNDAEGSRWGQLPWGSPTPPGVLSSPRCPQLLQVSPTPSGPHSPWVLQLWSWRRAGEACRGQQVPAWRARGGQSRAVCLNAPRRARRRGGRAWPSPGMGTLLGGVPAPREAAQPPLRAASSGRSPAAPRGQRDRGRGMWWCHARGHGEGCGSLRLSAGRKRF